MASRPPIIWSIAGHDSSGGAGLSADQRAADALGVHLCPVVSAITAQNSQGVQSMLSVDAGTLESQLAALALDLPPRAIKTGLLGSVGAVQAVARWVDHFRQATPVGQDPHRQLALVIDPVLGASAGGAAFADERLLDAYRELLLPRATVITPNRAEAARLLGWSRPAHDLPQEAVPDLARQLQLLGARSTVVTGGDALAPGALGASITPHVIDWLLSPHASGWLTAPVVKTPHTHGTGCTFATGVAAALALGHVEADAVVLAKMLTHHALSQGRAAGHGSGPVIAHSGFARGPSLGGAPLPWLGLDEALPWAWQGTRFAPFKAPADGLYGIVDCAERIADGVKSGLTLLQLRRKLRDADLAQQLSDSLATCTSAQATLFINDHWRDALALLAGQPTRFGIHLGQEDLLDLSRSDHDLLRQHSAQLQLGLSSHSLWELARAAGCGASMIACGPIQPTTTKDMPWQPQGHDNLSWWVAHSPAPVVAIGGLLTPNDVRQAAQCRPAAICIVRGLGRTLAETQAALPALREAVLAGWPSALEAPALPHPVL